MNDTESQARSSRCWPTPRPTAATRSAASTPMRPSVFLAGTRAFKVKRAVRFPFLDYSTLDQAQGRLRGGASRSIGPSRPTYTAAWCRSRARRTADSRSTATARRSSGRSRCAASTRTQRSTGWRKRARSMRRSPTRSAARWRQRMRRRRRSRPSPGSRRSPPTSTRTPLRSGEMPRAFSARRGRGPRRCEPRAPTRASVLSSSSADGWGSFAAPRRSPSRQHRAARRAAGPVRCHRVRSADRGGRRALRSRLPAHGPDRAWPRTIGQHRAQPLSRRDKAGRGSRRPRGAAVVSLDAGRDPRQGDGGTARTMPPASATAAIERSARNLFRLRLPLDRAGIAGPGRGRRAVRHRQIGAGARAGAATSAPAPGAVVLRSDVERKTLLGKDEHDKLPADAYAPEVTARVYATIADKARRAVAAGHSAIVDAVFAKPQERAAGGDVRRNPRRALSRTVPRRRSRHPGRPRRCAQPRRLRRRRRRGPHPGEL